MLKLREIIDEAFRISRIRGLKGQVLAKQRSYSNQNSSIYDNFIALETTSTSDCESSLKDQILSQRLRITGLAIDIVASGIIGWSLFVK